LQAEANFTDGKPNGIIRVWYKNGQLRGEANFKDGVLISEKCYDEDGKVIDCE